MLNMERYLPVVFIIVPWIVGVVTATNITENTERNSKTLGVFSVVRFPNSECTGSNSLNGTCYTSEECTKKSGTSSGSCASGFGVCCVFSLACGSTVTENNTYHAVATFNAASSTNPCTYEICPITTTDICKLRLDFETFTIAGPFTGGALADFVANPAFAQSHSAGRCIYDSFTITGAIGMNTLCGHNTDQHIYVPSLSTCNKMTIKVDTARTYTRSWNIAVKQIECTSEFARQTASCLQYLTGTSGTFKSFNYDTNQGVIVGATVHHLQSQEYDICFRQERDYCAVCFDTVISAIAIASSFGVSGNIHATIAKSGLDTRCNGVDLQIPQPFGAYGDYISIAQSVADPVTSSLTVGNARHCSLLFAGADDTIALDTVCTFMTPFKWGVHFSDTELWENPGTVIDKAENFANAASFGGLGFYMNWFLQKC